MYPNYWYIDTRGYKLPDDDQHGVQSLYGMNVILCYIMISFVLLYYVLFYFHTATFFGMKFPGVRRDCSTEPKPFPSPYRELAPESVPVANPQEERCNQNLVFDAATSMHGDLYFFKNGWARFFFQLNQFCLCECVYMLNEHIWIFGQVLLEEKFTDKWDSINQSANNMAPDHLCGCILWSSIDCSISLPRCLSKLHIK